MVNINTKTITRIAAVQGIYYYQTQATKLTPNSLIQFISSYYKDAESLQDLNLSTITPFKLQTNYLSSLIKNTIENLEEIDFLISSYLATGWKVTDLHLTLLAILRIAICELKFFLNTPHKVIINEFTNIANDLAKANEVGFVNSLLEKASLKIRKNPQ